jgi:hypothetical protein
MAAAPEMTVEGFAKRIGKGVSTARRIIARGEIDVTNIGSTKRPCLRISEADYQKWFKSRRIAGRRSAA